MTVPADFPKDRISLCMIVKNEAERLGRCLASAAPWVGEMVVVDTGSTDDTVAIAAAFGAKVVHFPWIDDFSAARNASLEAATRPWALILDGDEELEVESPAALATAVTQSRYAGFSFFQRNLSDDGFETRAPVFRLFERARPGMRYRGELHEQIGAAADGQVETATLPGVSLRHEGYLADVVASRAKPERNERLARKLVVSRPDDPHAWYVLGLSLTPDKAEERRAAFERAIALFGASRGAADEAYLAHIFILQTQDAGRSGDAASAAAAAERGLARFPHSPDLLLVRASAHLKAQDMDGAAAAFAACLTPDARAFPLSEINAGEVARLARAGLRIVGRLRLGAGEIPAGMAALAAAGDETASDLEALDGWFSQLLEDQRFDDVETALAAGLALGAKRWQAVRKRWAIALALAGFREVALHLLLAARDETPEDADLYYWIGFCALEGSQPDDARILWETCLNLAPGHPLAAPALALLG